VLFIEKISFKEKDKTKEALLNSASWLSTLSRE